MLQKLTTQIVDRLSMNLLFEKLYTTRQKRPPLKAIILLTDMEPEGLNRLVHDRKKLAKIYNIHLTKLQGNLYRLNVKRLLWKEHISGHALLDVSRKGVWVVFCNEKSYFVKRALGRLFTGLYPDVARLYVNYSQIHALLDEIKEAYKGQTTLTSFILKREARSASTRREPGTFQLWEENAEEELLRQSKTHRLILDMVNFEVRDENNIILLQAHISRKGVCKLRFGSFSMFYENVVLKAIDLSLNWKKFYGHRERIIQDGKIFLRPLRITYPVNFDEEQLLRLTKKISKNYLCSIIHGGNPYFVANVCDYQDGSSFGVTALGNSVTITPITRGSHQATWKLTNRLQEIIGDGEITSILG